MPLMLIVAFFVHMSSVMAISSKKALAELQKFYSVHACQGSSVVLGQQMRRLWFHKTVGGNVSLDQPCAQYTGIFRS